MSIGMSGLPSRCVRCGSADAYTGYTLSIFNTDEICMDCKGDEREAPGYSAAAKAELESVRRGQYNFPGVGLSAQDRAFLRARREARRAK